MLFNDDYLKKNPQNFKISITPRTIIKNVVYALELSKEGKILGYYIGRTKNLENRMHCHKSTFRRTTTVRKDGYMRHFKELGDKYKLTLVDVNGTTIRGASSYEWLMCHSYQLKGFRTYNSASMTIPQYITKYVYSDNSTNYSVYHDIDSLRLDYEEKIPVESGALFRFLIDSKVVEIAINENHSGYVDYVIKETLICVPFLAKVLYTLTDELDSIDTLLESLFKETFRQLNFDGNIESLVKNKYFND